MKEGQTAKLDIFSSTSSEEKKMLEIAKEKYETRVAEAAKGYGVCREVDRDYRKNIEDAADSILKKDRNLRLTFPFALSPENKLKLISNIGYYENDGILTSGYGGVCIQCGTKIQHGEVYVDDDSSAVCMCMKCAKADDSVDGDIIQLKINR